MGWLLNRSFTGNDLMSLKNFLFLYLIALFFAHIVQDAYAAADNAYYAGTSGFYSKSATTACQSYISGRGDNAVFNKVVAKPSDLYECWWQTTSPEEGTQYNYREMPALYCPQGQQFGTTSCGQPPPPPCVAGQVVHHFSDTKLVQGNIACYQSCEVYSKYLPPSYINCNYQSVGGGSLGLCDYFYDYEVKKTGNTCDPDTPLPTSKPKAPPDCPVCDCLKSGQSWGTVNGAAVCVPLGSKGSNPVIKQNPPVETKTTPPPTAENPNPEPVITVLNSGSTKVTPPPAGSPEGTPPVITKVSNESSGSTTETSESKDSFCEKNASSKLCKAETACEEKPEGPTCKHLCERFPDIVACQEVKKYIGEVKDIPKEDELEEKEIEAPVSFNHVSLPANSSCPAPQTISMYGAPITVSFQWLCDYASAFKPLMIAFALMFAATVVMSGVRSDSQPYQRGLF